MSLRDKNPMIDSDLEIVITTFEKGMIRSRDADSVYVPFRRGLEAIANFPTSVQTSIDQVPLASQEDNTPGATSTSSSAAEPISATATDDPFVPTSETTDDESWKSKLKELAEDCIPCDFRTLTSLDSEFFSEIGDKWSSAFDEIESNLKSLGDSLDGITDQFTKLTDSVTSVAEDGTTTTVDKATTDLEQGIAKLCELGNEFKSQCVPDLKKIMFILQMFLQNMEGQVSVNLNIFDSFLTSLLSPIFNEMAANLDLIDEIALGPIKCILDEMQRKIEQGPQLVSEAGETVQPVVSSLSSSSRRANRAAAEQADNVRATLTRNSQANSDPPTITPSRTQQIAERARAASTAAQDRYNQRSQTGLQRINQTFDRANEAVSTTGRFKEYLKTAFDFLEDKKDWLIDLIEDFISIGTDWWNEQLSFANGKKDILDYLAILKALIEAAKTGGFSCGPTSDDMTSDELKVFFSTFRHPSESLEVSVEGDTIVVVSNPNPSSPVREGGSSVTNTSSGDSSTSIGAAGMGNIVVRRPISSCLKKITETEAEQVYRWIQQLE